MDDMGDIKGFLKVKRITAEHRPAAVRIKDYHEVMIPHSHAVTVEQASRCMDCGTPFCHWACPIGNYIPEWNDLMFRGQWEKAFRLLDATNYFPEITGRLCPAFCEYSCVLGINDDAVTIRENELAIIEYGFTKGFIKARLPAKRTGKKIAVIGSGPAGLATAAQLNRVGHRVVVFERDEQAGGILRYGIPDFKLEKHIIDRRLTILRKEGIEFRCGSNVGSDYPAAKLKKEFDVICLCGGSRVPRDLAIKGRPLRGIYFAMDYLVQSNRRVAGRVIPAGSLIDAWGKRVVVIGGGDTGADCVGTAHRQGARNVVQIEVMPKPESCRTADYPWPEYPLLLKTSTSHQEGGERQWSILTKEFSGVHGDVRKILCSRVEFSQEAGNTCPVAKEIAGSEFEITADMIVLAVGFLHPEHSPLLSGLGVGYDGRGNAKTDEHYMTSAKGVFSAGDMHRGQSLIVWAIAEGRAAAHAIDTWLMGTSSLPAI